MKVTVVRDGILNFLSQRSGHIPLKGERTRFLILRSGYLIGGEINNREDGTRTEGGHCISRRSCPVNKD